MGGATPSVLFATSQESYVVDAQAADIQPWDLTPWSEIDGGKTTRAMKTPIGYSGRRNAMPDRPEDLNRQMRFP